MNIGILSDTHNSVANTLAALEIFRREGVTRLFHCGDITTEATVALFKGWDVTLRMGQRAPQKAALTRRRGPGPAPARRASQRRDRRLRARRAARPRRPVERHQTPGHSATSCTAHPHPAAMAHRPNAGHTSRARRHPPERARWRSDVAADALRFIELEG